MKATKPILWALCALMAILIVACDSGQSHSTSEIRSISNGPAIEPGHSAVGSVTPSVAPVTPSVPPERSSPDNLVNLPPLEKSFTATVSEFKNRYRTAPNEFIKSTLRRDRSAELARILPDVQIERWIGRVASMETTSDGYGALSVKLISDDLITLRTWNNGFSDQNTGSLIPPGSELYTQVSHLAVGDLVTFSGSFVHGDADYVREMSLTEGGAMAEPEFLFHFVSVQRGIGLPVAEGGAASASAPSNPNPPSPPTQQEAPQAPHSSPEAPATGDPAQFKTLPRYAIGQVFSLGYFSYVVNGVSVKSHPSYGELLAVDITIRNEDDSDSISPQIELLDESGNSQGKTLMEIAQFAYGGHELVVNLKPGKAYRAYATFKVPVDRSYILRVSGGLASGKKALITLPRTDIH